MQAGRVEGWKNVAVDLTGCSRKSVLAGTGRKRMRSIESRLSWSGRNNLCAVATASFIARLWFWILGGMMCLPNSQVVGLSAM